MLCQPCSNWRQLCCLTAAAFSTSRENSTVTAGAVSRAQPVNLQVCEPKCGRMQLQAIHALTGCQHPWLLIPSVQCLAINSKGNSAQQAELVWAASGWQQLHCCCIVCILTVQLGAMSGERKMLISKVGRKGVASTDRLAC